MSGHDTIPAVEPGALYVVATPIGHLGDLSARAARVLASVDIVAAEDTRVTAPLLARVASRARLLAAHQHNEAAIAERIVAMLGEAKSVALVTDAGTPGVSDPGARIVSAVLASGGRVIPVPGPSALTALASAGGLIEGAFRFEGFLPARPRARAERLRALADLDCPLVLFESPHRIEATIAAIIDELGAERWIVLGRELTKKFEEIHRCLSGEAPAWLLANPMRLKGEYGLILAPAGFRLPGSRREDHHESEAPLSVDPTTEAVTLSLDLDQLLGALVREMGASRATRVVERLASRPHREVYARALRLAQHDESLDTGRSA
jgi:16S rRNA (cytidine1402-2'-O)-methyltransferase